MLTETSLPSVFFLKKKTRFTEAQRACKFGKCSEAPEGAAGPGFEGQRDGRQNDDDWLRPAQTLTVSARLRMCSPQRHIAAGSVRSYYNESAMAGGLTKEHHLRTSSPRSHRTAMEAFEAGTA